MAVLSSRQRDKFFDMRDKAITTMAMGKTCILRFAIADQPHNEFDEVLNKQYREIELVAHMEDVPEDEILKLGGSESFTGIHVYVSRREMERKGLTGMLPRPEKDTVVVEGLLYNIRKVTKQGEWGGDWSEYDMFADRPNRTPADWEA